MKKTILFRADGNSIIGLGHLFRLFALFEIFKKDHECVFVTSENTSLEVIPESYRQHLIESDISISKEPYWLAENYDPSKHVLIADGYNFNSVYQKQIKELGYALVYIDDMVQGHMYADVVINHAPGIMASDYQKEDYTFVAAGTKFAILRPSFLRSAARKRIIYQTDTAFVCFGGSDSLDLSFKVVRILMGFPQIVKINVVLGAAYKHRRIHTFAEEHSKIHLMSQLDENTLCKTMASSNLAISSASTILYELCAVKMPIFSGFYVENQTKIYKGFLEEGAIYGLGDLSKETEKSIEKSIKNALAKADYSKMLEVQKRMFDSKIESRFQQLIKELC